MTIPTEFTAEGIADASVNAFTPYADFLDSGEPYRSMLANNPWARPPKATNRSSGARAAITTPRSPANTLTGRTRRCRAPPGT